MSMKSKKGYSLIEVAVGILILTVFLICSAALFNGAYNTYRMIQQRNLATNLAVKNMEELLQTDSNVLTGFFDEIYDENTGKYSLIPNSDFFNFVVDGFDADFISRYAKLNGIAEENVGVLSDEEYEEYIYADAEYLINRYIEHVTDVGTSSADLNSGSYAFLKDNINETGNLALLYPGTIPVEELSNYVGETMGVRTTITRIPMGEDNRGKMVYGNNVLKLQVEVFYTNKIDLSNLTEADVKTITLETLKIAD